jgi:hypothetical protein
LEFLACCCPKTDANWKFGVFVAQKKDLVLRFIADHALILSRHGSVQATWRLYQGRRLGPFYRLVYRSERRQHSIYLGRQEGLAEEVRRLLAEMQAPVRQSRLLARTKRVARQALRGQKRELDQVLHEHGLYLKGHEVRGWRGALPRPSAKPGLLEPKQ